MAPSKTELPPQSPAPAAASPIAPAPENLKAFRSLNESLMASFPAADRATVHPYESKSGITFAHQDGLPKLPIADLADVCRKYVAAVKPLQTRREHVDTLAAVRNFLRTDGPELQDRLRKYANDKSSYIEQFCTPACSPSPSRPNLSVIVYRLPVVVSRFFLVFPLSSQFIGYRLLSLRPPPLSSQFTGHRLLPPAPLSSQDTCYRLSVIDYRLLVFLFFLVFPLSHPGLLVTGSFLFCRCWGGFN